MVRNSIIQHKIGGLCDGSTVYISAELFIASVVV